MTVVSMSSKGLKKHFSKKFNKSIQKYMKDAIKVLPKNNISRFNFNSISWINIIFFLSLCIGLCYVTFHHACNMLRYEKIMLYFIFLPILIWLAFFWQSMKKLIIFCGILITLSLTIYQGDLTCSEKNFFLKYFLSSQSAIFWMGISFLLSMIFYWGNIIRSTFSKIGTFFAWCGIIMGFTSVFIRWYESYLINPEIGHIPFSNLYEVLILFSLISSLFYLYFEEKYPVRVLGAFIFFGITSVNFFLVWYATAHDAAQIQPLMPALDSWWMKLHVPANFVGYGTFFIAGISGFSYIIKFSEEKKYFSLLNWFPIYAFGSLLCLFPFMYTVGNSKMISWKIWTLIDFVLAAYIISSRKRIALILPNFQILVRMMNQAISIGFAFFSMAIILGALWAADAWGMYWQWDPKETWSLIVWLNYAAWLHARLNKRLHELVLAFWALIGFLITTFAFLGVNIFLSGLHAYGSL